MNQCHIERRYALMKTLPSDIGSPICLGPSSQHFPGYTDSKLKHYVGSISQESLLCLFLSVSVSLSFSPFVSNPPPVCLPQSCSILALETRSFTKAGFCWLSLAGGPENSRDPVVSTSQALGCWVWHYAWLFPGFLEKDSYLCACLYFNNS